MDEKEFIEKAKEKGATDKTIQSVLRFKERLESRGDEFSFELALLGIINPPDD
jgi:hypothetical protein